MNSLSRIIVAASLALAFNMGAAAQQNGAKKQPRWIQENNGEITLLGTNLHFKGEKAAKFEETYSRFAKEIADASKEVKAVRKGRKLSEMPDSAIDSLMKARFRNSRNIMDIREKYYGEFRTFLTPREVQIVYDKQANAAKRAKRTFGKAKRRIKAKQ